MTMEEGTRGYLLAPIIRDRKGEYKKEFLELRKQGFQRVKVDGQFYELDEPPTLDKKFRHDIDVVVDRIVVREGLETRLADSFRTALDLASGIAILETAPRSGSGDDEAAAEPEVVQLASRPTASKSTPPSRYAKMGIVDDTPVSAPDLDEVAAEFGLEAAENLYAALGSGDLSVGKVVGKIAREQPPRRGLFPRRDRRGNRGHGRGLSRDYCRTVGSSWASCNA
mgnify:CR=1 FL=1